MHFGTWEPSIHESKAQIRRINRAKSTTIKLKKLDTINQNGVFKGSLGRYKTKTSDCTCFDFTLRNLPCKHMYRLAHELGLIFIEYQPAEIDNSYMDSIASMSDESQKILYYMSYLSIYHKRDKLLVATNEYSNYLVVNNYCIEHASNYTDIAKEMTAADLKRLFNNIPFDDKPHKNAQKKTFLKWFEDKDQNNVELLNHYFKFLELSELTKLNRVKTHRFLYKKYERTLDF